MVSKEKIIDTHEVIKNYDIFINIVKNNTKL